MSEQKQTPTWRQIAENPQFQQAPWEVKQAARAKFFDQYVKPQVQADQQETFRDKFFTATEPDVFGEPEGRQQPQERQAAGGPQMPEGDGVVNAAPAIEASQPPGDDSMGASLGRGLQGIGNRATDLAGNLIQGIDTYVQHGEKSLDEAFGRGGGVMFGTTDRMREAGYEPDLELGGFGVDFTRNADPEDTNIGLQELGQKIEDTNVDAGQNQYDVDRFLKDPSIKNVAGMVAEQGPASLVDMGAMAIAPFSYFAARNQEIAEDRVKSDKREGMPTRQDMAAGGAGALLSLGLDRFSLSRLLPNAARRVSKLRQVPGAVGRGATTEAVTEGAQEGIEYGAANIGTEIGATAEGAGKAALGGVLIGGPIGGGVRAATATGEAVTAPRDGSPAADPKAKEDPDQAIADEAPAPEEADQMAAEAAGDLIRAPRSSLSPQERAIRDDAIYGDTFKTLRGQAESLGLTDVVADLDAASNRASAAFEQETLAQSRGEQPEGLQQELDEVGDLYSSALQRMASAGKPKERKPKVKMPKTQGMTEKERTEAWRNAWKDAGVENPDVAEPETFDIEGGTPGQEATPEESSDVPAPSEVTPEGPVEQDAAPAKGLDLPAEQEAAQPEAEDKPDVRPKPRVRVNADGSLPAGLQMPPKDAPVVDLPEDAKPTGLAPPGRVVKPRVRIKNQVDQAAKETDTNPSPKKAAAGNYRKGKVSLHGMNVSIENPKGSTRRGVDPDGRVWENKLAAHYGDIKRTEAADGNNVDVFIGDKPETTKAFVIDQVKADGTPDEPKVMLGYETEAEARKGYLDNYKKGWKGLGAITETNVDAVRQWVQSGDTKKPYSAALRKAPSKGAPKPRVRVKEPKVEGVTEVATSAGSDSGASTKIARDTLAKNMTIEYDLSAGSKVRTGISKVRSAEDVAHIVEPYAKRGQESMLAVLTDNDGNLKGVIRHSMGSNSASAVYFNELASSAAMVDGATNIWLAHNHPSGSAQPSGADIKVNERVRSALDGSGMEVNGHVIAVAGGQYVAFDETVQPGDVTGSEPRLVTPTKATRNQSINVGEKVLKRRSKNRMPPVTDPKSARKTVMELGNEEGVVLLDTSNTPVGFVPMTNAEMKALREDGRASRLLKAIGTTNAKAMIVVANDEFAANNVSKFANRLDQRQGGLKVLDALVGRKGDRSSMAEKGGVDREGMNYYRLAPKVSPKVRAVRAALKPMTDQGLAIEVVDSVDQLPAELQARVKQHGVADRVGGVYHRGTSYIVASNITPKEAIRTALHEVVGHDGVRRVLGSDVNPVMDAIHRGMPDGERRRLENLYASQIDGMTPTEANRLIAEEYVAHMAETNPRSTVVSRVVAAVRRWLRNAFGQQAASEWSRDQIVQLIAQARRSSTGVDHSSDDVRYAVRKKVTPEALQDISDAASLDTVMDYVRTRDYRRNRQVKVDVQARVRAAAKKHKIDLTSVNTETERLLSEIAVRDAETSLETNANAVGWYDETVTKAIRIVGLIHPEILTDERARFGFTYALAVTSNGLKVGKNFQLAEKAYRGFKKGGRMPSNVGIGQAAGAINEALELFNLMEDKHGWETFRDFMLSEFTVGQLTRMGLDISGENADTKVRGAQIIGPKIGNGFFSNLNGHFDSLTMDRWLMRTWGRWTGTLIDERPDMERKKRTQLKTLVRDMRKDPKATKAFEGVIGSKLQLVNMDKVALEIQKSSIKPENRKLMNETPTGQSLRKVGNSLAKYLDGQKEAPANGTERSWIRSVLGNALETMRSRGYEKLTMADLQALLWYSERRLYDTGKNDDTDAGYSDDEAPDYANAAELLARSQGISDQDIASAIEEVTSGRTATAGPTTVEEQRGADAPVSVADEAGDRGFGRAERSKFLKREVFIAHRLGRGSDAKARLYKGTSRGRAGAVRGVSHSYEPTSAFNQVLNETEVGSPIMEELIPSPETAARFRDSIGEAKANSKYGAAVYVYDQAAYEGMRMFMSPDGSNGFAIKPDGDIVSVFSSGGGNVHAMLTLAVEQGGTKLDAFDTNLPEIYGINGFREVARDSWVEKHKPEGWSKNTFKNYNGGEPDVVYMEFDPSYDPFYDGDPRYSLGESNENSRRERAGDGSGRTGSGGIAPLEGAPAVRGGGPNPELVSVAESYARSKGIQLERQAEYAEVDVERAEAIAQAYENMEHAPKDPAVRAAYRDLIEQTTEQYQALSDAGYTFSFFDGDQAPDPYDTNPWNSMRDMRENKHMAVFSTEAGFGSDESFDVTDNPLLEDTGLRWPLGEGGPMVKVLANDLFRAVHDAFGHGLEGAGFRARGEENAWQAHVRLFTGPAAGAMTSETRGQNNWLNHGPHGEHNRTAGLFDTIFADQKTGLMPEWTWEHGKVGDATEVAVSDDVDPAVADADLRFKLREKPEPKKTVKGYKLFRTKRSQPGKLFPLFVQANEEVPGGTWLDADFGDNTKSRIGKLAPRPGWHLADSPSSLHIGGKANKTDSAPSSRPSDQVWAEVEVAADVDWQQEANARAQRYKSGPNKGDIRPNTAEIRDEVPVDGYYRYKTNPNMQGNWIISGAIKVSKILSDAEVVAINEEAGTPDLPRQEPMDLAAAGFDQTSFDDTTGDVRYTIDPDTGFGPPDEGMKDRALRWMADKMRPALQVQRSIAENGGEVNDDNDVYLWETLFHGKLERDIKRLKDGYVTELAEGLARNNITQDDFDEFLYARHAQERNAKIAERNPGNSKMQDGGSGMTDQEAADVLARVSNNGQWDTYLDLADTVYDMLALKRDALRTGGLEEDAVLDAWDAAYEFYVPLKGWAVDEDVPVGQDAIGRMSTGKGFEAGGKNSQVAAGRKTKAASPSTQAIIDTTESLVKRRKNEVGNALLSLVTDNPSPGLWEVFTNDNPDMENVPVTRTDPDTGRKYIEVVERPVSMHMDPRYFKTKKYGKTYFIKIKDQRLLNAMRNVGPEQNSMIIKGMGAVTRMMSSLVTTYSPEFIVTNFARDVQTALLNVTAEQTRDDGKIKGRRIAFQAAKDVPSAMRAAYRGLVGKQGKNAEQRMWDKYFEEFLEDGAKTGYFDMKDVEGQAKELHTMMRQAQGGTLGNALKFRKKSADFIENVNGAVENANRLSAYVNARRAGVTRPRASDLAKNLTVNFNRRGEAGTALNAFFMFANASIQGTANFARTMVTLNDSSNGNYWGRLNLAQKIGLGMVGGTFALSMFNRMISDEDDDGELFYDKIADHVKERNFIIMTGGKDYVRIPLPYGYNIFAVLGTHAEAAVAGKIDAAEVAKNMALAIMGSFSPIGFDDSEEADKLVMKNITPTMFKSITQLAVNEDFAGRPIYKENFPFGAQMPDSSLSFRSTPDPYKGMVEFMNKFTGGSEWRSGGVDVSPDSIQHIINFYGGGAWGFTEKAADTSKRLITGEKIETYRIPFAGKLLSEVSDYPDIQTFYERRDLIAQYENEFKNMGEAGADKFFDQHGGKIVLKDLAEGVAQNLTKFRQLREVVESDDSLSAKEKDKELEAIEESMDDEVDYFNKIYNEEAR